jgi:predicted nucleotidyltransferase
MNTLQILLSSRVKAEVLRLLFGQDAQEIHFRKLARLASLNEATVRQEVRRLSSLGLVVVRKDGNRSGCSANRAHPLFVDLAALVLKTSGIPDLLRERLGTEGIRVAFVFGSIASGEAVPESDVDLMVIGPVSLRQVVGRLSGIPNRLGREVNPHVFTAKEIETRRAGGDHFVKTVLAGPKLYIAGDDGELERLGGQPVAEGPSEQP